MTKSEYGFIRKFIGATTVVILVVLSGLLPSCTKDDEPDTLSGQEYMPLSIGNYWVYNVSAYNFFGGYEFTNDSLFVSETYSDTSYYQIKEELFALDTNISGEEYIELRRYKRPTNLDDWTLDSIWTCRMRNNQFIKTENNIAYVKLDFPVYRDKNWDPNIYNELDSDSIRCELAYYDQITDIEIDSTNYNDVLEVIYCEDSTALANYSHSEYYGAEIGLIRKEYHNYDYCFAEDSIYSCIGREIIDNGTKYIWELVEFNVE